MKLAITVDNDYQDMYAPKEFVENELVPKYFSDIDASLRTVGMIGYTTELITNISEDAFNAGAVLFRESFPNRAQISESIYSHAAIFQLSNVFSSASSCKFLLVMEEAAIIKNMINYYDSASGIYHFFIDKNTKIYVEDTVFTIDYDIDMSIVKTTTDGSVDYLFTAKYIMGEGSYVNSISDLSDPYIKVRRSSDGFIALEVQTHQCTRDIRYESLISSNMINFQVIDITFDGKIAGFDVLYKKPTDEDYSTQLETKIIYSQASSNPFCYYQMIDNNTLRISFNSKDKYFKPVFDSEIEVILYITDGTDGTFDVYNGTNISLVPEYETYNYSNTYLTAASPLGSSSGGSDQMDLDSLQSLTVENYRTATALTTEHDLQEYFFNYKYKFGDAAVMFIKKRNDVAERVYSSFLMIKKDDYIYNTNTLNLSINLDDMRNSEKNIWILDPGYIFTCNSTDGYAEFYRDEIKNQEYYNTYLKAIEDDEPTAKYIDTTIVDPSQVPAYLNRPCSFATFKSRYGLDDKLSIFDVDKKWIDENDSPTDGKFIVVNPFLIRFKKNPNLVSTYMTYVRNTCLVDFTDQNEDSYVQFILYTLYLNREFSKYKKYDFYTKIGPSITVNKTYPIISVSKFDDANNIEEYKLNDKFSVVDNDLRVILLIKDNTKNICFTELYPTDYDPVTNNYTFNGEMYTDDYITSEGLLRILSGKIYRNPETGEYYKVQDNDFTKYNLYDASDNIIAMDIAVDEVTHMINEGTIQEWRQVTNMTQSDDIYIPMENVSCEIYTLYRRKYSSDTGVLDLTTPEMTSNIFSSWDSTLEGYIWTNQYVTGTQPVTFMKALDSVRTYLSFDDFTEAKEVIDDSGSYYEKCDKDSNNALLVVDDEANDDGNSVPLSLVINDIPEIQIGEYVIYNEVITKNIMFAHDIMDVKLSNLSFLRASTTKNSELLDYFMNSFYAQYTALTSIINTKLRNETNLDVKFYNTYGRSRYFLIGENNEILNTVNLRTEFDVWFVPGTDVIIAVAEVKKFIKRSIEELNRSGMNNIYISNLIRKIESKFSTVDHLRFVSINNYSTDYQAVKNYTVDLDDLTVEERRSYVPEFLVSDLDDIIINPYYAGEKQ